MFNLKIKVNEKPDYHIRTYHLPDFFYDLLHKHDVVEGDSPAVFQGLVGKEGQVPGLLAEALFNIEGVEQVKMGKRSFTITYAEDVNGPSVDRQVILAITEVMKITVIPSVEWLDLILAQVWVNLS
jgi:hypothetical protein